MHAEGAWTEPRLCHYSGLYFCPACHWNNQVTIPAHVICNWDFVERPVSRWGGSGCILRFFSVTFFWLFWEFFRFYYYFWLFWDLFLVPGTLWSGPSADGFCIPFFFGYILRVFYFFILHIPIREPDVIFLSHSKMVEY